MRRISAVFAILALAGMGAVAKSKDDEQSITVYVNGRANMPGDALPVAEHVVGEIFAKIGVNIIWHVGQPKKALPGQTIVLDITADAPATDHPGALAYALEYEGVHIAVFYDRVQSMATRDLVPKLLGHVLAHEITHILEGVNHHSPEGIMKAHWTGEDIAKMAYKPLPFDPADVQLVHLGFGRRSTAH